MDPQTPGGQIPTAVPPQPATAPQLVLPAPPVAQLQATQTPPPIQPHPAPVPATPPLQPIAQNPPRIERNYWRQG